MLRATSQVEIALLHAASPAFHPLVLHGGTLNVINGADDAVVDREDPYEAQFLARRGDSMRGCTVCPV